MKFPVRKVMVRGESMWLLDARRIGKGRIFRTSEAAIMAEASQLTQSVKAGNDSWTRLSAGERNELALAYRLSKERGHDLFQLIENGKAIGNGSGPKLKAVIEELIAAKKMAGRSKDYATGLKTILNQFAAGKEAMAIGNINVGHVEQFLNSKRLASRSTLRSRISTLFKFAVRRGYRSDNPCARLEAVTYHKPAPTVLSPKQFTDAFTALRKRFKPHKHSKVIDCRDAVPWFVLTTCCGLRPEEALKTTKEDIHFTEGWIRIESQTTKVRERRIVYPRPEAMALLQSVMKRGKGGRLPLPEHAKRRAIHRMRATIGFKVWPKDITRHTAASYWLADGGSTAHVSKMLGNSEKVLERDYKALATNVEAKGFWKAVSACK